MTTEALTMIVVDVLGKFIVDNGATILKDASQAAAQAASVGTRGNSEQPLLSSLINNELTRGKEDNGAFSHEPWLMKLGRSSSSESKAPFCKAPTAASAKMRRLRT